MRDERFKIGEFLRGSFVENMGLKFVAFVLALTVFILVHNDKDREDDVFVPVHYVQPPQDRVLVSERMRQVTVTVRGSYRRIKRFDAADLEPVEINLTESGDAVVLRAPMFRPPPGITIERIDPPAIQLRFEPKKRAQVPIEATTTGELAPGWRLVRKPARRIGCTALARACGRVTVEGAASAVDDIRWVRTEEISLAGRNQSFTSQVQLIPPSPLVTIVDDPVVEVDVQVEEEYRKLELGVVPLALRAGANVVEADLSAFTLDPAEVRVVVLRRPGAEPIAADRVAAYVEVQATDVTSRGPRRAPVLVEGLPSGVAIELEPRVATLQKTPK